MKSHSVNWLAGIVVSKVTALDSYRSNPYPLLESMLTAKVMYARVVFEGIRRDVKFDLTEFAESVRPVIDACPKKTKSEKPA
ncbi:MAG: hypothetical protein ISN28_07760 [Ectothiorhodospiraceae bacterium AqS1]|nr:hypothetical protein [Ectothiorhodospiraceae bacterium AqS1]MBF2760155.1 hypothetical protein [Ectothiorhodospiraceae bacterium AqS1]